MAHRQGDQRFRPFCPYLEKIFDTERRFAGYCAPEMHPYNYCLNKYEDGLTMDKCDEFFAALKSRLVPLIAKLGRAPQLSDSCIHGDFDEAEQEKFSLRLMETIGIDMAHCGLGTTEHPFTTSIGSHKDVRITTNYDEENLASSIFCNSARILPTATSAGSLASSAALAGRCFFR